MSRRYFDNENSKKIARNKGLREYSFVPNAELNDTNYTMGYISVDEEIADSLALNIPDTIFNGGYVYGGISLRCSGSAMDELERACYRLSGSIVPGSVIMSVRRDYPVLEYTAEVNNDLAALEYEFKSAGFTTKYDEKTTEFAVYSNPRSSAPVFLGSTRLCNLASVCEHELEEIRQMINNEVETDCTIGYSKSHVIINCKMSGMSKFRSRERFDVEMSDKEGHVFHDIMTLNTARGTGMTFHGRKALEDAGFADHSNVHVKIKRLLN